MLVIAAGDARAQQPAPSCDLDEDADSVVAAFAEGVNKFQVGRDAGADLCKAACCWPYPDASRRVELIVPGKTPYLPFYWRGRYYLKKKDYCRALRYLNLAECKGEVVDKRAFRDAKKAASKHRIDTPTAFYDGYKASKASTASTDDKWYSVALNMIEAMKTWDEDGRDERPYGRWPAWYLPRYYLASAMVELGCREAADVLLCAEVAWCQLGRSEAANLEPHPKTLLAKLERRPAGAQERNPDQCDELRRRVEEIGLDLQGCCACSE